MARVVGLQFFCLGLLGEVSVRTYFESQAKPPYTVCERINIAPSTQSLREAA